ncbi:hypothetical protein J4E86_004914 [Alternaria arbusti]|uniref:uncharacterized protein n=1 Tax=Alternaria arbusti TaxID=232088 RepID=UPI002220985E|nr:uncharacterized protein J4E86_004914 [Alternaria arbusti]KAI4957775.1 hypothetical protein J4E86_004914 [Alternaria arbusti]
MSSSSTGIASTPSTSQETQTPESTEASPSTTESEEDGAEATESPDVEDAAIINRGQHTLGMTVLAVATTLSLLAWL